MVARRTAILAVVILAVLTTPVLAGCVTPAVKEPSEIRHLRVIQDTEGGARVLWNEDPAGVADHYRVYKNGVHVADVDAPKRTWLDTAIAVDETATYTVSAVLRDGTAGPRAAEVSFTYRQALTVTQEADVSRGFVNFTVVHTTPGLRWTALDVAVAGTVLTRDDLAYWNNEAAWTHSEVKDPLVDIGDRIVVYAPDIAKRHATFEVSVREGRILDERIVEGRPVLNLTLEQSTRNATGGLASLTVKAWEWHDQRRDVTDEHPDLVPRWRALTVLVNGTALPYDPDGKAGTWRHDRPSDTVLREGGRIILNAPGHVHAGAVVVIRDAVAQEESFHLTLR